MKKLLIFALIAILFASCASSGKCIPTFNGKKMIGYGKN